MIESLYIYNLLTSVSFAALLACFGQLIAIAVAVGLWGDGHSRAIQYVKPLAIGVVVCGLILILIPRDRILALMLIAPYIEDNREVIQALPKEIADFLFELIREWKK